MARPKEFDQEKALRKAIRLFSHQVIGGCGGKALLRKKVYRLPKRFLLIKLLRSRHAPLLFQCCRSDYATYPPSMVRLALVMKPASSDAREETKLATSDTSPIPFKGMSGLTNSSSAEVMSVGVGPGGTLFTVMARVARSMAAPITSPVRASLGM